MRFRGKEYKSIDRFQPPFFSFFLSRSRDYVRQNVSFSEIMKWVIFSMFDLVPESFLLLTDPKYSTSDI